VWGHEPASHLQAPTGLSSSVMRPGSGPFWSDYFGHFGSDPTYKAGFEEAISNITEVGVSFGGGCLFEDGVGEANASGTFTLNRFKVE
jgi:hypothetical protein